MNVKSTALKITFCMALVAAGCRPADAVSESRSTGRQYHGDYPVRVVCTTGQVAELVARVGGDRVKVDALMAPGVDPHLYSPVPSDVRKLSSADAIFYNGLHLEGRMADLFVQMARSKLTFAVTEGLQTRDDSRLREPPEFEGLFDPHVWHDPELWADCAADVATALSEYDPDNAAQYRENAEAYRSELAEVDEHCRRQLAAIPKGRRVLITAHDAFGYFGQKYGIEVHGLKGVSTDEEKDLDRQQEIQKMIIERRIPAVFVESAVAPKTMKALVEPCRAAGWDLKIGGSLYADALGPAGTDDATYAGMMRANVRTIVDALSN